MNTTPPSPDQFEQECAREDAEYLCPAGGGDHEWVHGRERYGDDADGNRGIWIEVEYCRKCKQEKGEL